MAAYSESEMYNIWSRMDHDYDKHEEMISTMSQLFGLSQGICELYDSEFTNKRNERIYDCTHPLECSRVKIK